MMLLGCQSCDDRRDPLTCKRTRPIPRPNIERRKDLSACRFNEGNNNNRDNHLIDARWMTTRSGEEVVVNPDKPQRESPPL
jgi:hypothetical protein